MKQIVLINTVTWSELYPPKHLLKNVGDWFTQYFQSALDVHFQITTPDDPQLIRKCLEADGIIMSGSPRDAWADDTLTRHLCDLILKLKEQQKPFLGVCYGHQILARALGGQVGRDPKGWEVGLTSVKLTEKGKSCPLFKGLEKRFKVVESHQDAVLHLPSNAELLASGEHTPIQAFHVGENLYGVQFHPEMNRQIISFVWEPRIPLWKDQIPFNITERLAAIPKTSNGIVLRNFVKYLVPV